jgi:hypothetical protein
MTYQYSDDFMNDISYLVKEICRINILMEVPTVLHTDQVGIRRNIDFSAIQAARNFKWPHIKESDLHNSKSVRLDFDVLLDQDIGLSRRQVLNALNVICSGELQQNYNQKGRNKRNGELAGLMLIMLAKLANSGAPATLENCYRLTGEYCEESERTIAKHWKEFRSTIHYYAGFVYTMYKNRNGTILLGDSVEFTGNFSAIHYVMALSYAYFYWGEAFYQFALTREHPVSKKRLFSRHELAAPPEKAVQIVRSWLPIETHEGPSSLDLVLTKRERKLVNKSE